MHSVYLHYNISVIQAELVMIGHFFNHFTPDKYLRNYKSLTVPMLPMKKEDAITNIVNKKKCIYILYFVL